MSKSPEEQPQGSEPQPGSMIVPARSMRPGVSDLVVGGEVEGAPTVFGVPALLPAGVSILAALGRRKWLILIIFLLVSAVTVVPVWLLLAPKYRATAYVRVSPVLAPVVWPSEKTAALRGYREFLATEVAVIHSATVLERVLDRPDILETRWYRDLKNPPWTKRVMNWLRAGPQTLLEELGNVLQVEPLRGTELIMVPAVTDDPGDAEKLANLVVNEYDEFKKQKRTDSDAQHITTVMRELQNLQDEIDGEVTTRIRLAAQLGTDKPEEMLTRLTQQVLGLEADVAQQQRDLELARWDVNTFSAVATTRPAVPATMEAPEASLDPRYVNDADRRKFHFELSVRKAELEIERQKFGVDHPRIRRLTVEIESIERLRKEREAQLDALGDPEMGGGGGMELVPQLAYTAGLDRTLAFQGVRDQRPPLGPTAGLDPAQVVTTLRLLVSRREEDLRLLKAEVGRQRENLRGQAEIALAVAEIDARIRQKRETADALRHRLEVLQIEGKALARVLLEARATRPSQPDRDRRPVLTVLFLAFAAGVGLGAGYLRALQDKRIYGPAEIKRICQFPFLGVLPRVRTSYLPKELGGSYEGAPGLAWADWRAGLRLKLVESVRMIRTTLLEQVSEAGRRVILVTSALPGAGKSSVAVLLAQSLAVVGKKVLLIEGDVRRPALSKRLGLPAKGGLAALLSGKAEASQVIVRGEEGRFDVIPVGEVPSGFDPELLAGEVLPRCLAKWRESYDFILLDSPPLLPVADAQILAGRADGTIIVLRSRHDQRTEAMEAYSRLSAAGGQLIGTILVGGPGAPGYEYGYAPRSDYSGAYSGNGERGGEHSEQTGEHSEQTGEDSEQI